LSGVPAVTFRAATAADADGVAALHADSWRRYYRGAYADSFLDGDVLPDRRRVWSRQLARPRPDHVTILAGADAKILGFVHVALDDDRQWGSLLDNLHVTHGSHRRGIGSALLGRAAQAVVERAATGSMYLWVLEQNTAAQAFYAAHGGRFAERDLVESPGGVPGRLQGHPVKLRYVWTDAREVTRG
jgi:ribosomal protein S18 acetylase RimI-like enzyme